MDDPVPIPSLPQDKPSLLRHLEKNSPETLALARDWDDIAVTVVKAGQRLKKFVKLSSWEVRSDRSLSGWSPRTRMQRASGWFIFTTVRDFEFGPELILRYTFGNQKPCSLTPQRLHSTYIFGRIRSMLPTPTSSSPIQSSSVSSH